MRPIGSLASLLLLAACATGHRIDTSYTSENQEQPKVDPGPRFPWKRLADQGLITWPDAPEVARRPARYDGMPDAETAVMLDVLTSR